MGIENLTKWHFKSSDFYLKKQKLKTELINKYQANAKSNYIWISV